MKIRNAVIVGLLGKYADRFHEYQPARSFYDSLKLAAAIPGVEGIEVVYPQDFTELEKTAKSIKDIGLPVSAVNLNVKSEAKWRVGSFTSPDPAIRAEAIGYLKTTMDLAAELGAEMITCCPLIDGHDYPFTADYQKQWAWLAEGIREGARHRSDIKISIEYKPYEVRNQIIVADMGRALHLCNQVGLPNVGVTMDVGHALAAKESPAAMACMAHDAGRLFYVHFNDNDRGWDWDMIPGSVNVWETLETMFYLDRMGWSGWLTHDVFARHGDPAESFAVTLRVIESFERLLDKMGRGRLQQLIDEGVPHRSFDYLIRQLVE